MDLTDLGENGLFAPRKIASLLLTTQEELARSVGLGKDAVQRKERVRSDRTQRRLREMVEILNKVEPRFGSPLMAYAWYRSEPLAGFAGQTPMQLVLAGRATDVLDYVDAVDAGVHAQRTVRYRGLLYRALNPLYAREPLSGEGARRFGGRFNAKGVPALYTSLSPHTALRESAQVGTLQPTVLLAYEADVERVFDARDEAALTAYDMTREAYDMTREALAAADWRERMRGGELAQTQRFARTLIADGFTALLVPSYARGAKDGDDNLVLFAWSEGSTTRLRVIDDERRLH